ncbi:hypothetical protein KIW84_045907 [Lathyrus oleraceus]|uniref:Uncharacterized protein n=1 Tax=Pisum sativum TaxID=3888 RepID=A0A9D4XK76_PEA|nr:hypothetical protein KIW84_045907 [Pisum sativum]
MLNKILKHVFQHLANHKLNPLPVVDIHVFAINVNDILDVDDDSSEDLRDENSQNEKHEIQGERNVEADEDDAIPISNIIKIVVEYIMVTKHKCQAAGGNSSLVSKGTLRDVLLELMEVTKALQETITVSTIRKRNMDDLIKMMTMKKEAGEEDADSEEEKETTSNSEEE